MLATAIVGLLLLLFPLPRPILSPAMERSSGWLLADGEGGGRLSQAARKIVGLELQLSLAAEVHRSQRLPPGLSEAQRIAARLGAVKSMMIDQTELPHARVGAPAAIAGLVYCDGLNGFAATVLSHEYDEVGIVAVDDPATGVRHSFGRLRSPREGWLYFDLWTNQVAVFRSRPGHPADYLAQVQLPSARPIDPGVAQMVRRLHDRAFAGIVHNRLQPTLGGYAVFRAANWLRHGDTAPAGARAALAAAARQAGRRRPGVPVERPAQLRVQPTERTIAASAYGRARYRHLIGDTEGARAAYAEVLRQEGGQASLYGRAAQIFLQRLATVD